MSLDRIRQILSGIVTASTLILAAGMFIDNMAVSLLGLALIGGTVIVDRVVRRCPHCKKYMKKLPIGATTCTMCGESLEQ